MYINTIVVCDPAKGIQTKLAAGGSPYYIDGFNGPLRHTLLGKRLGDTVPGEVFSSHFSGYVFKILGGNDRRGHCMRQGILTNGTARILMRRSKKGVQWRKKFKDQRMRRTVHGCIIGKYICSLSLEIIQHGKSEIPGMPGTARPKSLGPKRASKIRMMFGLDKNDDVKKYVVRKKCKNGKTKAPRIQRLVTPERIKRKRTIAKAKEERFEKRRRDMDEYKKAKGGRLQQQKTKHVMQKPAPALTLATTKETRREERPQPAERRSTISQCWRGAQS